MALNRTLIRKAVNTNKDALNTYRSNLELMMFESIATAKADKATVQGKWATLKEQVDAKTPTLLAWMDGTIKDADAKWKVQVMQDIRDRVAAWLDGIDEPMSDFISWSTTSYSDDRTRIMTIAKDKLLATFDGIVNELESFARWVDA